jgi:hypothetical protein
MSRCSIRRAINKTSPKDTMMLRCGSTSLKRAAWASLNCWRPRSSAWSRSTKAMKTLLKVSYYYFLTQFLVSTKETRRRREIGYLNCYDGGSFWSYEVFAGDVAKSIQWWIQFETGNAHHVASEYGKCVLCACEWNRKFWVKVHHSYHRHSGF